MKSNQIRLIAISAGMIITFSFLDSDYLRLNEILSDSTSQLGYYTPAEIHPPKQKNDKTHPPHFGRCLASSSRRCTFANTGNFAMWVL